MIDFKQYITELRGPKPANSNAQHDSDHDMIDVSDDSVVRKLNSFLGCIADMILEVYLHHLHNLVEDLVKILILHTMSLLTMMVFRIGLKVVVPLTLFMKKKKMENLR